MATQPIDDLLKQKLIHYLDGLESAVRQGGDIVITQAPEIVREMVTYRLVTSGALCVLFVINLIIFPDLLYKLWRWNESGAAAKSSLDEDAVNVAGSIVLVILILGSVAGLMMNADIALKCYFAPKYFVLEQVAEMLRK